MLRPTLLLGCALACSALLSQTSPIPTGPSTSATLIGPGGGGGGGGTTGGITLRCIILGTSTVPSTLTGTMSHLGGDTPFTLSWNGKTAAPPKGRTVLQFGPVPIGGTNYQPLPSTLALHYGNQNSCAVTFVPPSTSVGFISGLEITQGTQTSANNVPLQIGKKARLKIMGCGLNFSWANYTVDVTVNGQTTSIGLSDSVSPAVNNGAWDGDPIARYTSLDLPDYLVWSGMMVTVKMTNAPTAPYGRTDLFPTTMTLSPSILIPNWGSLPVRVVLLSQNGVLPPIYQNTTAWSAMMDRINTLLPWGDLRANMTYLGPIPIENLRPDAWQQNDPMAWWNSITWGLYYQIGGGYPIIGIIDQMTPLGQLLGSGGIKGLTAVSNGALLPAAAILAWDGDTVSSAETFAHEFGHTSGRHHAPSVNPQGQVADSTDYGYPYQSGNSSVGAMATFFDTYATNEYAPSRGATGSSTENQTFQQSHELMGYGGWYLSKGTSDYTFGAIRQYWGIWSTVPGSGITTGAAPALALAPAYILVPEQVRNAAAPVHPAPSLVQEALAMKDAKAAYEKIKPTLAGIQ